MFTVLIAEKKYIDAIRLENKLFFEPFLANKELAFCYWNPEGQNLSDSVPGLIDVVGSKKEWKAIIINSCTDVTARQKNPFDVVDYREIYELETPSGCPVEGEDWDKWEEKWALFYNELSSKKEDVFKNALELPLQKLTTYLAFRPKDFVLSDVHEKDDVDDWAINEIGRDEINPFVRLERLEREQYRREFKIKEMLRREFVSDGSFDIEYPKEIYCISTRTSDDGFFNPEPFWNVRSKNEYSEFCDRNMYLDKIRFLVFDILPSTHKSYRYDQIRFLSSLLIFATNDVPTSTMQARKLHVLECKNDDVPLYTLVTSYHKKLATTYEIIGNEIEHIYSEIPGELTDKVAESLFYSPMNIAVKLDENCDFDDLIAENDFSYVPVEPLSEIDNWQNKYRYIKKNYGSIMRHQSRSLKKGIDSLNVNSEISDANISRLTSFQLDDIKEFTENAENEMVSAMPPDFVQSSKYEGMMKEQSDAIENKLEKRMSRSVVMITSAIVIALICMLYVPFIVTNISSSEFLTTTFGMLGITLFVLILVLLITLIILKMPLNHSIKEFNSTMRTVADDINENMRRFSKYFSLACNVRRGYKVQEYAVKNLDSYTKSIRIRRKHQEDIRKISAELEEMYSDFIGDSKYFENTMIQPYDYDFSKKVEYTYEAPFLAGFCRNVEFLEAGNLVEVSSGYITHISIRMEEIYDK